ncbi:MAG TPA: HisA/HisF-related TIM barrel protein [Hansschlegelia sp.]
MDVIPVIDLMNGEVVHARRGERGNYRPIVSPLAKGSSPTEIASALMDLAPFRRLYVADLDAIFGRPGNDAAVAALARAHPAVEIWVDRGDADADLLRRRAASGPGVSVVGAEAFSEFDPLARAIDAAEGVLSLDYDAGGRMGPAEIYESPDVWPHRLIVMTLARVGAGEGPDVERLTETLALAGDREVFAAGGVRGAEDLEALEEIGVAGALVASALHDGRLTPDALRRALEAPPRTARRR